MELKENKKLKIEDMEFTASLDDADLSKYEFIRVYAVEKIFRKVDFGKSVFNSCYFRNCHFINCDFSGAVFKESNFKGAQFEGCKFRYNTWEKTLLEEGFLQNCLPSEENLARDLVRSLRVNFTQIGNYEAVNMAASIEVQLTGKHLSNAAFSRQSYYRSKYKGRERFSHVLLYFRWCLFQQLWGNGESIIRIICSASFVVFAVAALYAYSPNGPSFGAALVEAAFHFWGMQYEVSMPPCYSLSLTVIRFITFGLFMSVLVKRLSRR